MLICDLPMDGSFFLMLVNSEVYNSIGKLSVFLIVGVLGHGYKKGMVSQIFKESQFK